MNSYFIAIASSIVIYVIISLLIKRGIQSVEDYYVAGRRAGLVLIVGSITASVYSSSVFTGTAGTIYDGAYSSNLLLFAICCMGYVLGGLLFGRFLRRSKAITVPEFFEIRFCSSRIRKLAAITGCVTMLVYLLSITQGVVMLVNMVTGISYSVCAVVIVFSFSMITILSGSKGVLVTDTIMACIFIIATVVAYIYILNMNGGWFHSVHTISKIDPELMSWNGKLVTALGISKASENIIRNTIYGVVWFFVYAAAPWQSSRWLMAKDEHTVIRASVISSVLVFGFIFLVSNFVVSLRLYSIPTKDSAQVVVWSAMNLLPMFLGVIMLTGIMSAGISSATTFLSLIGFSVTSDLLNVEERKKETVAKTIMMIASGVILVLVLYDQPAIFRILSFGAATIAASWGPIAIGCIYSKRMTEKAAFWGMLIGFSGCFFWNQITNIFGITIPIYFDAGLIGIALNIIVVIVLDRFFNVTEKEIVSRIQLLKLPETERKNDEMILAKNNFQISLAIGIIVIISLTVFWVLPFWNII